MRFNTFLTGKYGNADGAIETQGNEIVVFRKGILTRSLFGALGTSIAHGKEVGRFSVKDISGYQAVKKRIKTVAVFDFKDGSTFTFDMKGSTPEAFDGFMTDCFFSSLSYDGEESGGSFGYADTYQLQAYYGSGNGEEAFAPSGTDRLCLIAAICFAAAALMQLPDLFRNILSISTWLAFVGYGLIAAGLFCGNFVLSAVGCGLDVISLVISLITLSQLITIPSRVIFSMLMTVLCSILLAVGLLCRKKARSLFFFGSGVISLIFLHIAFAAGAILLGVSYWKRDRQNR